MRSVRGQERGVKEMTEQERKQSECVCVCVLAGFQDIIKCKIQQCPMLKPNILIKSKNNPLNVTHGVGWFPPQHLFTPVLTTSLLSLCRQSDGSQSEEASAAEMFRKRLPPGQYLTLNTTLLFYNFSNTDTDSSPCNMRCQCWANLMYNPLVKDGTNIYCGTEEPMEVHSFQEKKFFNLSKTSQNHG